MSSSLNRRSPNSDCRWRSPRPFEFRADLMRIPSILYMRHPRSILAEPFDYLNFNPCAVRPRNGNFRWRQDPPGWPGRCGHLPRSPLPTLGGPSLRSSARRGPLHFSSLRNRNFSFMLLGLRIRWWGDEFDSGPAAALPRARHSLLLLMLLFMAMFRLPALHRIKLPTIPPSPMSLRTRKIYDTIIKKEYEN